MGIVKDLSLLKINSELNFENFSRYILHTRFFIGNIFVSNNRLKLAKKIKQKLSNTFDQNVQKKNFVCFNVCRINYNENDKGK